MKPKTTTADISREIYWPPRRKQPIPARGIREDLKLQQLAWQQKILETSEKEGYTGIVT